MKLKEWAREQGVSYRTALNWFHAGTLPVAARQLPTGTILAEPPKESTGRTVAYCRVSSVDQKDDLYRQAGRVAEECSKRGITLNAAITEVGSGLHGRRTKLAELLADPEVCCIVVEHRDRLARCGVEHLESVLCATGRIIIVLNAEEVAEDLVCDITEVFTSMCACLYGRRSANKRAQNGLAACAVDPLVMIEVIQAYWFVLAPTSVQEAPLRSHCGAQ